MTQHSISALGGRYAKHIAPLVPIVSEYGLMRYRVMVMCEWLKFLSQKDIVKYEDGVTETGFQIFWENYDDKSYLRIKELEATTNHDVKAVEYYIREHFPESVWPWIHFGCTSEDVNNVAYALMLEEAGNICNTELLKVEKALKAQAENWKSISMLSRTHGQPATPTTVGKEFAVFIRRISRISKQIGQISQAAKWNGATGNHAAQAVAFPDHDWVLLSEEFINTFHILEWNPLTTQIESHDIQAELMNELSRVCGVLIDLCSDVWGYISLDYLGLKVVKTETGSSTMPGKVNPIDFENARGNFEMSRGIARILAERLPISTWQRDLTDSTLQRNFGLVFGHYLVALKSLQKGLGKLEVRTDVLEADLECHPEVLGEAIQTVLRKHGQADAYEKVKDLLRGNKVTLDELREFIKTLPIPEDDMSRLLLLTPATYVGLSERLVGYIGD